MSTKSRAEELAENLDDAAWMLPGDYSVAPPINVCSQGAAELRRLAAECEALRADAERYRWLVSRPLDGSDEFYISAQDSKHANADGWWALGGDMSKAQADAYINAAMKASHD